MIENMRMNNPLLSYYAKDYARIRPNNKVMWRVYRDYWGNLDYVETRVVRDCTKGIVSEKRVRRNVWRKKEELYTRLAHGYNAKVNRWL
jgi:hypothetical protein